MTSKLFGTILRLAKKIKTSIIGVGPARKRNLVSGGGRTSLSGYMKIGPTPPKTMIQRRSVACSCKESGSQSLVIIRIALFVSIFTI